MPFKLGCANRTIVLENLLLMRRPQYPEFQEEGDELPEGTVDLNAEHIYSTRAAFEDSKVLRI